MTLAPDSGRLTVRSVPSIRDVDSAAWDQLAGDNPQLGHGWLRTLESEWQEPVERLYLLVEDGPRLVAAAACHVESKHARAESIDDLLFGRLRSIFPAGPPSLRPALVCGFPWVLGSGCLVGPARTGDERRRLTERLVEEVTARAERARRTAVFMSVTETETDLMNALRARGYRGAAHMPLHVLDVQGPDFEAYRRGLPSRNIRKNIRRELNKNRKQGVVITEPAQLSGLEDRLFEIVQDHRRRYGQPPFPYSSKWLHTLKSNLGEDTVVAVAHRDGQLVGVAVSVRKLGTRQLVLVGVDHEAEGGNLTHFNLAYYWPVAECIRSGDRQYIGGPGQRLSRRRRGYGPVRSHIYCRPRGALRRAALGLWMHLLSRWLSLKAD